MPFHPYLVNPKPILIRKTPTRLEIETMSGRNVFLVAVVFMLLFQVDWLKYTGILASVIISTYSQRWLFDTVNDTARRTGKIIGITYNDFVAPLSSIREAFVNVKGDGQAIGNLYQVYFRLNDGSTIRVAQRNAPESLIRLLNEMVKYLPDAISPVLKNPSPLVVNERVPT